MAQNIHKPYPLTTAWQQIEPQDAARVGVIFQNQSGNIVSILLAQGEQSNNFAALEIVPTGALYEDILPPSGAIWAKAASGTATLTLVLKY